MIKGRFMKLHYSVLIAGIVFSASALAKIPPAPPPDPVVAAAKAEKDKAAAEKTKADQSRYEDAAVANFQANMKKAGKPIPKPTPIVVAAAPAATAVSPVAGKPMIAPAKDEKSGAVGKK
jgi:hypothetical protein